MDPLHSIGNLYRIPKTDSLYTVQRSELSEDDSIYFFTLRALSNSGSFTNLHFFMNSTVYFGDSILWNTDIISIKDAPVRRRWFEVYDSNMVPLEK